MKRISLNKFLVIPILATIIVLNNNCSKDDDIGTLAILITTHVDVAYTSATSGGKITSNGGSAVTARGVCWSTNPEPTITDSKTTDGTGIGTYTSNMTGLTPNTTYFVRAYATNKAGIMYGNEISFTTKILTIPTLTTSSISNVTQTSATSGGDITSDGGAAITARGVCWSTNAAPTIADNKTEDGTGMGSFSSNLSALTQSTTYYLRAYATNSLGTAYGDVVSFTTSVADADGNVYKTVNIGTQVWFAENLKTTTYRNGDLIGTTISPNLDLTSEASPKYQWAYNGLDANAATYGRLYTWFTVTDSRNVCPTGWHVPSREEWDILVDYLGRFSYAGRVLKEAGTAHWLYNPDGTNRSGFTALPAGSRRENGEFQRLGVGAVWWTSTISKSDSSTAVSRSIDADVDWVYLNDSSQKSGVSVRCIKD